MNRCRSNRGLTVQGLLMMLGLPLLVLGGWWLLASLNRDLRKINQRLTKLEANLTMESGKSLLATAASARAITAHFTEDLVIKPGRPLGEIRSHKELQATVARIKTLVDHLEVDIEDRDITLDKQAGTATAVIRVRGAARYQSQSDTETRVYRLHLVRTNGTWLIQRVEQQTTFRKSD